MRSLRRVLLPLVLLSGLAFRGVRFDDADAAPAPFLLPFPPPPPQPPLALPAAGDEADSTEIVAAPLPPRELLVTPPRHRSVPTNAVIEPNTGPGVSSELQFYDNGTIQLVDRLSQAPLWEFSTGPPLSKHITTTNSDLSYLIYPLDESELVEVHNGTGVKLPWELEEFIARTPYIRDSVVTVGSKASTIFAVDADSGEIIYKHSLPAALNELGKPPVEEAPSKLDAGRSPNVIVVVRTDYSLSASDLGVHLFNWTRTSFSANYYVKDSHPDMLEQSSCLRGNVPCIRTDGVPLKLTLPDSSTANALVLLDVNKVTNRDDADNLRQLGTLVNSRQTASKSGVALDGTQNRTVGGALGHLVSADPQANRFTNNAYGFLFPVLPLLVVLAWLARLAYSSKSCRQFMSLLMKPFVREKKSMDLRGKSEGISKRRKTRKKDGTANSTEVGSASDKESSGTGGSNETLYALPDGLGGCQIGKLRVHKKEIGKGSNGTVVFEGSYDGREVAVKRLLLSHTGIAQKEIQNLIASDRDPNIVRLYGCDQDDYFVYISLERCRCSLADLIQQHKDPSLSDAERIDVELWTQAGLPSVQLLKLMRDVVAGIVHLHSLGIIHRDLKPQNVLISKEGPLSAKLSDMGISKRLQEDMASLSHHGTGFGSSGWQAPEQLRHESQTRAMDLFSLGYLIFYCITKGNHPFGEYYERDMNIINGQFDLFVVDHIPEAVHLISQLLRPKPEDRPTAVYAINHPLFWSPELRLLFLRDTSDRVEKTTETDLLNALESIGHVAFGGKWREKLDDGLVADVGRYRKYNFESTRDLLRLIRNKSGHYRELPADLKVQLGNGQTALFWEDRWIDGRSVREIAPLLYACIHKRRRKRRTVAEGLTAHLWARDIQGTIGIHELGQYLLLWRMIERTTLTAEPDRLRWRWNASGIYSAQSAYLATFQGSTSSDAWKLTWKSWAPPRVRFFHWLAHLDRCWTADRLARRGLQHPARCPLCDQAPETMHHLLLACPFSRQIWHEILSWLRMPCQPPNSEASLNDWWITARQATPMPLRKGLASATLLVPWMVWKHRNDCVFDRGRPSITALTTKIKEEATLWASAGALGLRAVIPQTWDVH